MYAQCPECLTFFRLKPSQLKAAKGQVRCSRCKHVFDALETLRDEPTAEEIAAAETARKREPKTDSPLLSGEMVDAAAGDLFDGLDYTANEELELDEPAAQPAPPLHAVEPEPYDATEPMATPEDFAPRRARPRHRAALTAASVLLALLLGAQLVHWQRLELAQQPLVGPWLVRAYAMLGSRIEPPRDLAALRVFRTEVSTHPDHPRALYLTAMLENTGRTPQPWPELHVDLQDRWGETVGARYFTPQEYLREPGAVARPLPPNGRFAIALALVDPGSAAVGFRIEPCFAVDDGAHACPVDGDTTNQ